MGFKAISTRRTSATSAVSNQAVVINTGTGNLSVGGSAIQANTSITLGVTTPGQSAANSAVTASGGPTITSLTYLDANNNPTTANAVSTSGGNIKITGTGFVANSSVYINNSLVTNTFVSSSQITAVCPAASAGNVSLFIFSPTNVGALSGSSVRYSGAPTWTTSAVSFQNGAAANVALVASSDSTLTYTLQAGSTLPTGISLNSAGYLAGTATGYSTNTSSTVVLIATDQEGQATQQTINITVTVRDPQFPYTTMLLNAETSVTPFIADASTNNFGLTVVGDTKANKFTPYRGDGYYSNYFPNSFSVLSTPVTTALDLGTGDFTIECWALTSALPTSNSFTTSPGGFQGLFGTGPAASTSGTQMYIGTTNIYFDISADSSGPISTAHGMIPNTWYHIAVTRSGTTFRIFINGALLQTATSSTSAQNGYAWGIGAVEPTASGGWTGNWWYGNISNFRVIKGTALYTSAFTPSTTPLTAIANTSLLTCQSNRFIDKSTNALALTVTGSPQVSPAIPFAASSSYATYGSMYVPSAVTNYLSLAHTANTTITSGSTDSFVAECWVYFTSATASTAILDQSGVNTVTFQNWSLNLDSTKKFQIVWGATGSPGSQNGYISGTTVAVSGVWYHLAYVKTNADWSLFVNGVREATFNGLNTASDGTSNPLRIGSDTFSSQSINGYIADLRIYKGATAGAPYSATSSTITVPTAPLTAITNTQLLTCQYNGAANNYGIIDNGPFNNPITRVGNTAEGSFSPYSQTGWSNYFNGTSGLQTPAGSLTNIIGSNALTTSTFTIECWINPTVRTNDTGGSMVGDMAPSAGTSNWSWGPRNDGKLDFYWYNGGGSHCTGSSTIPLNTWTHVALVVANTSIKMFVNGVQETLSGTTTLSAPGSSLGYLGIGMWNNGASGNTLYAGYISNMRIVKSALYSTTFTPSTTPLTAIANTSLLTAQSNRFLDNSSNAYTLTVTSAPSVQAFCPFAPPAAYTPSSYGGSCYFDGTGDYLTTPASSITNLIGTNGVKSTSTFTIETWIYQTQRQTYTTFPCLMGDITPTGTFCYFGFGPTSTGVLQFFWYDGANKTATGARVIPVNTWTHIAVSVSAGAIKLFVNGNLETITGTSTLTNATGTTGYFAVGQENGGTSTNGYFGYVSDLRITPAALYTTAFTPPTSPLTNYSTSSPSSLLLNFTEAAIVDAHSTNVFETASNTQVSTAIKKFGNTSMSFVTASSQYLKPPATPLYAFGTGDFTLETWVYILSHADYRTIFDIRTSDLDANGLVFGTNAAGQAYFYNAGFFRIAAGSISTNTWTHLAWVRQNGVFTCYINGSSVGTSSTSVNVTNTAPTIGRDWNSLYYFNGYMDDFRITKGFARYTANFTAPTSQFLGQ